jgi:hypothetical protein
MPVEVHVSHNNKVIMYVLSDPMNLGEMAQHMQRVRKEIVPLAGESFYAIADLSRVTQVPNNVVSGSAKMVRSASPNMKTAIIVTRSMFIQRMVDVLMKVSRRQFVVVPTRDKAFQLIEQWLGGAQTVDAPAATPTDTHKADR